MGLFAQQEIQLNINHLLNGNTFAFGVSANNNMASNFNFDRLQYYISEISIKHDGGQLVPVTDTWFLVNAGEAATSSFNLGSFNISEIEGIILHIGVEEATNHLDPSSWAMGHPLAPQFPSMHWGWASGYRFIAVEGMAGPNLTNVFELHGLGDSNYFTTEIDLSATLMNDGVLHINVDADYARILENLNVNSGIISHGETGAAQTALENYRDYVFTPAENTTTLVNEITTAAPLITTSLNNNKLLVNLAQTEIANAQLILTNINGQCLSMQNVNAYQTSASFNLPHNGMYILQLWQVNKLVYSTKVLFK